MIQETKEELYKISIHETGARADSATKTLLEKKQGLSVSREFLQEALKTGTILLQGKQVKPLVRVTLGEILTFTKQFFIELVLHNEVKNYPPLEISPKQIAKKPGFIVVSKPAGLLTHSFVGAQGQETLETWLEENIPQTKKLERAGIVHRLDRNTSGLLLVATNELTKERLSELFQSRSVKKTYVALCHGHFKILQGSIEAPLIRKKGSFKRVIAKDSTQPGARDAATEYQVIARSKDYDVVLVHPKTGRTHQIRAHMKALGHPIVGDTLYGGKETDGLKRQFLHAFTLELTLEGKNMSFRDMLPEDLTNFLKSIDREPLSRYDDEAFEGLLSNE
jgi:23S rRNA pseudouridine1911/1915/1917 synthase